MTVHSFPQRYRGAYDERDDRDDMARECKDRVRRALDEAEFDPGEVIELLAEAFPTEVAGVARELGQDAAGARHWAHDARERRRISRDSGGRRARRAGLDEPPEFRDMPRPGEDRRRAHDIAFDRGTADPLDTFRKMFGDQAADIGSV